MGISLISRTLQTPEMKLTAVLLLGSLSLCHAGNGNAMERLLDDLFEDSQYNSLAIPMKSMWKDFRLMWEPSEYDGVDRLFLPTDMIWTPDLSVYNGAEYGQDFSDQNIKQSPHKAVILNTGTVIWIPAIKIHADCSDEGFVPTQPANPAEERDCHVKIGSWVMDARHVNLTSFQGDDELSLDDTAMSRLAPGSWMPGTSISPASRGMTSSAWTTCRETLPTWLCLASREPSSTPNTTAALSLT